MLRRHHTVSSARNGAFQTGQSFAAVVAGLTIISLKSITPLMHFLIHTSFPLVDPYPDEFCMTPVTDALHNSGLQWLISVSEKTGMTYKC